MGINYNLNLSINEERKEINEFINYVLNAIFPKETHSYSVPNSNFYIGIKTDLYTLDISKISNISRQFTHEDYRIEVNTSLSFHPYGKARVEGIKEIIRLTFTLLKHYNGDCIFLPNGNYAAFLRRKGELFVDTSKGFFNHFDFSLIEVPYTDIVID